MRHTVVQNSSGRQVVWCRWIAALEQAACFTAVIWQSLPIQKTVENVFVCQGLGCGASWLLLLSAGYKYSYLLTYLITIVVCPPTGSTQRPMSERWAAAYASSGVWPSFVFNCENSDVTSSPQRYFEFNLSSDSIEKKPTLWKIIA